jgi:rod shape-determining protein MreD
MPNKDPRFPGAVLVTLLIALVLTIIPLGEHATFWRPEWVALTLVHWALVIRDRLSLVIPFLVGLAIDTLYGSLLGQHALGYVLVAYFAVRLGLRMSPEAFLQQFALLFAVLGLYMLVNLWIQRVTGEGIGSWLYWASLFSSLVIWPIYHTLLGYFHVQRKAL